MSYAYGTHQRQEERAKADRAWGAGARPRGSWTKSEIVRMIDKKLGFVEAAVKALADNPWEYDELLSKERRLRKYCGCGVGHDVFLDADTSLAALQRECEARAGKRRSDKGDAEGQL